MTNQPTPMLTSQVYACSVVGQVRDLCGGVAQLPQRRAGPVGVERLAHPRQTVEQCANGVDCVRQQIATAHKAFVKPGGQLGKLWTQRVARPGAVGCGVQNGGACCHYRVAA